MNSCLLSECCEVFIWIFSQLGDYLALANLIRRMCLECVKIPWVDGVSLCFKVKHFLNLSYSLALWEKISKSRCFELSIACTFPSIDVDNNKLSSCSILNSSLPGLYLLLVSPDQLQSAHVSTCLPHFLIYYWYR